MFPPPILFIFGFKHKPTFICPFCAQTPCVCGYIFFLKQAQQSLCNVLKERRTETKKERQTEREPNTWGANNKLKFTENLYKKNISTQTSESDVSKSLISICTFKKKKLYNSIIVQIPAPISKGCLVQEKKKKKKQWGKSINKSMVCGVLPGSSLGWGIGITRGGGFEVVLRGWDMEVGRH